MEDNKCCAPNYEEYYKQSQAELMKAIDENHYLRDELRQKEREMSWHYGFKEAVELIFRKGGCNG